MYARVIKVLIIDDSIFFRNVIARALGEEPRIEVVGMAGDPFEARDKILELEPDVLTLDIQMPQMDGIEFLQKLMPQYPIPALIVSAHEEKIFMALEAGAVDFVKKPLRNEKQAMDAFMQELILKTKIASTANVRANKHDMPLVKDLMKSRTKDWIIAIGASTGGTEAVCDIIKELPKNMPGIIVVQHMPEVFTKMYADRLNKISSFEVKEAKSGDLVLPGRVLIAAGGYQTKLCKDARGFYVECYPGALVNGHRPSVDVLFHSVASEAKEKAIGIILTGMGYDGAKGLLEMKKRGAYTIGQDEKTCIVYGMPKVAYDIGGVCEQYPLPAIAKKLYTLAHI